MTGHNIQDYIVNDIAVSALISLGSLVLEEISCHVVRTLKQPYEKSTW